MIKDNNKKETVIGSIPVKGNSILKEYDQ